MSIAEQAPTFDERRGHSARRAVPRSSHGNWAPAHGRDPLAILAAQDATRVPELVPIKYGRMVATPFTFFRGAAAVMAADLADTPVSGIKVQLCGDAHLSNFGMFAAPDRRLVFDLNDFDETAPGPWEWDVKRLAASFAVAARSLGHSEGEMRHVVKHCVRRYQRAMREFAAMGNLDVWYARIDVEDLVATPLEGVTDAMRRTFAKNLAKTRSKDSMRAFSKLTEEVDGRLRIKSDPPLLVRVDDLLEGHEVGDFKAALNGLMQTYRSTLPKEMQMLFDRYEAVDLARKVVGVGSVGTRAWILLLMGREGGDPLFLQVKEAEASVLERYAGTVESDNHGRRVVEGQRAMQAAGDIFLGWLRAEGIDSKQRDFYVRQLWDQKGSAQVEAMDNAALALYSRLCGWTLARAHARTGDRAAIASYLGGGDQFVRALVEFSLAYAECNERDHALVASAVQSGAIAAVRDL